MCCGSLFAGPRRENRHELSRWIGGDCLFDERGQRRSEIVDPLLQGGSQRLGGKRVGAYRWAQQIPRLEYGVPLLWHQAFAVLDERNVRAGSKPPAEVLAGPSQC